jgi:hypothetical protein
MQRRTILVSTFLATALTATTTTSLAANNGGFKTARPPMLTAVKSGVTVTPLLTVGDELPNGYVFESIPDGISVRPGGQRRVALFVNHETSKVPFPYVTANPTVANSESDFDNSQVSQLTLNAAGRVVDGSYVIDSGGGFQRFCSNYLATSKEGFDQDIFFTNEESPDYVFRQENSWPPPIGDPAEEENGVVLALDPDTGDYRTIYGMGRHNHENNVAIPGFDDLVVLSGDDTFTSGPLTIPPGGPNTGTSAAAQSQLYSYIASDTDELLDDEGDLWAFVSDDGSFDDYYDFVPGSTHSVSGHFIKVPKNIATGKDADGSELKAADLGYPLPPTDGSWQLDLRSTASPRIGIDGPQWVLEYWSQLNNVFDFVRVEDIAYDKRAGRGNVIYVVDSGRGTPGVSQAGRSTNGRVWKMVFDTDDPTQVDSLSIVVEGDDNPVKTLGEIHQPDNIETTNTGLLVTEDPGSSQQFALADQGLPNATTARLWYTPFSGAAPQVVARIDQSADGGPTDVGPAPTGNLSIGNWGAWETTGIVDASAAFGAGAYLINIQAHTLWVEKAPGPDTFIDANSDPDFTFKREGGQLLLIRIPGI